MIYWLLKVISLGDDITHSVTAFYSVELWTLPLTLITTFSHCHSPKSMTEMEMIFTNYFMYYYWLPENEMRSTDLPSPATLAIDYHWKWDSLQGPQGLALLGKIVYCPQVQCDRVSSFLVTALIESRRLTMTDRWHQSLYSHKLQHCHRTPRVRSSSMVDNSWQWLGKEPELHHN